MSNIFKFYISNYDKEKNKNILTDLYLFIKNKYFEHKDLDSIENLNKEYSNSNKFLESGYIEKYFKNDFSDLDKTYFKNEDYDIKIHFIDENIYNDDTIETAKLKFVKNYNNINTEKEICYEEIYMFGLITKTYNALEIYNKLSNYGKLPLKKEILIEYFYNINERDILIPYFNKKDIYEYNDLNELKIDEINIQVPLGHIIHDLYNNNFTTNPFNVKNYNFILKNQVANSIEITNNTILFENNLLDNNLYISLFEDVIKYNKDNIYDNLENVIKIYFPLFSKIDINNYDNFLSKKRELLKNTKEFVNNDNFNNKNKFIDIIYNIYHTSSNSGTFNVLNGIFSINFNMYSNINLNLSIETLFKLFNSTNNIPFIKYNPGKTIENLYRLYCNKISENNKKIPLLKKETISEYAKNIGKMNTISMAINDTTNSKFKKIKHFLVEINSSGIVNVNINFNKQTNKKELEELLMYYLNDVIFRKIEDLNNYNITNFKSFDSTNIEILNIDYNIDYNFTNKIEDINKIKKCLNYIFYTENTKNSNKILYYKYKRVSNYDELNSINDFIIENIKLNVNPNKIIELLKETFNIKSYEECKEKFQNTIENLTFSKNLNNSSKLIIKNNCGFKTKIIFSDNNNIKVIINNINNINYIPFINIFLDSIMHILNNNVKDTDIATFCNTTKGRKKNIEKKEIFHKDEQIGDITKIDKMKIYNKDLNVENIENYDNTSDLLSIQDEDEDNNLLDILLFNEDEEEDEEEDENKDKDAKEDNSELNDVDPIDESSIDQVSKDDKLDDKFEDDDEVDEDDDDSQTFDHGLDDDGLDDDGLDDDGLDHDNDLDDVKDDVKDDAKDDDDSEILEKKMKSKQTKKSSSKNEDDFENSYRKLRLEKYEPRLFSNDKIRYKTKKDTSMSVSKTKNNFVKYSRICQVNQQPIILTEEEKDKILRTNPDAYDMKNMLEYSLDDSKKHYYICPKFWDMKNNMPLSKEEVDRSNVFNKYNNKHGNILERKDTTKFDTILEPKFLQNKMANLKDFCLPCCYTGKSSDSKIEKKKKRCMYKYKKYKERHTEDGTDTFLSDDSLESDNSSSDDEYSDDDTSKYIQNNLKKIYISQHDRNKLSQHKVGDLPIILGKFFQFDIKNCKVPGVSILKQSYSCLLRYGIENSSNQSFIACISDAYSKYKNLNRTLTIKEFKEKIIIQNLSIDNFIKYNNGNLTHIFLPKNINDEFLTTIDIGEYDSSDFYKNINPDNINQVNLYKKIIISYNNFKKYLRSNNHVIDYTYLWDIICKANSEIFENGINLLIFDITSEDVTENVKVICPQQNYSNEFIDNNKKNLILIKNNNLFEPIYIVKDAKYNRIVPLISFEIDNNQLNLVEFKRVINIIKDNLNEKCISSSNNETYDFEDNIDLYTIVTILLKLGYNINNQLVNYENKTIGLFISEKIDITEDKKIEKYFIPCYPSKIYDEDKYKIKFIDDKSIQYNNYKNTKMFLFKLYELSEKKIKIKPKYKIIQDSLIVGILTNGDQVVIVDPPEMYIDDELESIKDENYLINDIDRKIQTSYKQDNERILLINNIKLENAFYKNFKTVIKKLLVYPLYVNNKKNIINIVKNPSLLYLDKLSKVINELKIIGSNNITFAVFDNVIIENIKKISNFMNECNDEFCVFDKKKKIPNITIPAENLITKDNNEDIYYLKAADEFIRFNFEKIYLYDINKNYNIENINYDIDDNEVLILQSSINSILFNEKIYIKNKYENYTNYDTFYNTNIELLEPIKTKDYKIDKKRLKADNFGQPIGTKMKINIPKLPLQSIKKQLSKIKEEKNSKDESRSKSKSKSRSKSRSTDSSSRNELTELRNLSDNSDSDNNRESDNLPKLEKYEDPQDSLSCVIQKSKKIKSNQKNIINYFKDEDLFETFYNFTRSSDLHCSYNLIITLIKYYYKEILQSDKYNDLNRDKIKNILIKEYQDVYDLRMFYNSLKYSGIDKKSKKDLTGILKTANYNSEDNKELNDKLINNILTNDNYYISLIDLYIIIKHYNIPVVFINNDKIINTKNIDGYIYNFIIANTNTNENNNSKYFFIKLPSTQNDIEQIKKHKLIHLKDKLMIDIKTDLNPDHEKKLLEYIEKYNNENFDIILNYAKKSNKSSITSKK